MCNSLGQYAISRYLNTNNTLLILLNQVSKSDVEDEIFEVPKRMVHLK